jgi:hypothetical protein
MWEIEFQGKQHVGNDFKGNIAMDLKKFWRIGISKDFFQILRKFLDVCGLFWIILHYFWFW